MDLLFASLLGVIYLNFQGLNVYMLLSGNNYISVSVWYIYVYLVIFYCQNMLSNKEIDAWQDLLSQHVLKLPSLGFLLFNIIGSSPAWFVFF
jgi:hypothetical protein